MEKFLAYSYNRVAGYCYHPQSLVMTCDFLQNTLDLKVFPRIGKFSCQRPRLQTD